MKNLILSVLLVATLNSCAQSANELQKKYTVFNRAISSGTEPGSVHLNDGEGDPDA